MHNGCRNLQNPVSEGCVAFTGQGLHPWNPDAAMKKTAIQEGNKSDASQFALNPQKSAGSAAVSQFLDLFQWQLRIFLNIRIRRSVLNHSLREFVCRLANAL